VAGRKKSPLKTDAPGDSPTEDHIRRWTDHYFLKTKKAVERFGDVQVTYAVFMRRPVVFAPRLMVAWLEGAARTRGMALEIEYARQGGRGAAHAGGGFGQLNRRPQGFDLADRTVLDFDDHVADSTKWSTKKIMEFIYFGPTPYYFEKQLPTSNTIALSKRVLLTDNPTAVSLIVDAPQNASSVELLLQTTDTSGGSIVAHDVTFVALQKE